MAINISSAKATLREMMQAYLVERDLDKTLSYLTDDLISIGTGKEEIALSKEGFRELLIKELQMDPEPYQISLEQMCAKAEQENSVSLFAVVTANRDMQDLPCLSLTFRLTAAVRLEKGEYKVSVLHASAAAASQEDQEFFPLRFGEKTILELRQETQAKLIDFVSNSISGGMMGGYIEPGFPLYFVNNKMLDYLGYTYEEFVEATEGLVTNCMVPEDREYVDKIVYSCLKTGDEYEVKYRMLKKDGSYIWVWDRGKKITAENGRPAIISVCIDITQTLRLQQELAVKAEMLEKKNAELEAITNNVPGGVCELALDGRFSILYGNEAFYQLFGCTPAEMGKLFQDHFLSILNPDDAEHFSQAVHAAFRKGEKGFEFEGRFFHKSGMLIWLLLRGTFGQHSGRAMLSCVIVDITNRKKAEQELLLSEERFRVALTQTQNIIFDFDVSSRKITISESMAKEHGLPNSIENVPESLIQGGYIVKESADAFRAMFHKLICGKKVAVCTVKVRNMAQEHAWCRISLTAVRDEKGQLVRAIGLVEDITKQKKTELLYFQGEQYRNAMLAESVFYCEVNFSHNRVETFRENICEGFSSLCGRERANYEEFLSAVTRQAIWEEDQQKFLDHFSRESILNAYRNGAREVKMEHRRIRENGPPAWFLTTMHMIWDTSDETVKGFAYMENIDEQKKNVLSLQYKSERDSLTGLYNKMMTENQIRSILEQQAGARHAFLIVDVDNFKQINDQYGHMVGDRVLSSIASRMQNLFRPCDILGRIGGDEFVIFMRDLPGPETAMERAEALLNLFHQTSLPGLEGTKARYHITCSIGISLYRHDGNSFESLYRNADIALYQAKNGGRDQFVFYHPNMAHLEKRNDLGSRTEIDSDLESHCCFKPGKQCEEERDSFK